MRVQARAEPSRAASEPPRHAPLRDLRLGGKQPQQGAEFCALRRPRGVEGVDGGASLLPLAQAQVAG